VSFQVKANHQQITYYLALMLIIYALALLVWLLADKARRGSLGRFFAASALLIVMGLAGIATNANKLIPVYKYTASPHAAARNSPLRVTPPPAASTSTTPRPGPTDGRNCPTS
jgi:hypothetical protein